MFSHHSEIGRESPAHQLKFLAGAGTRSACMSDKRQHDRAGAQLTVRLKSATGAGFDTFKTKDVSEGGFFAETTSPMVVGALVRMEIAVGGQTVTGVGRVVWTRPPADATPSTPAGMGVKFVKITSDGVELVRQAVDNGGATATISSESEEPAPEPPPKAKAAPEPEPASQPEPEPAVSAKAAAEPKEEARDSEPEDEDEQARDSEPEDEDEQARDSEPEDEDEQARDSEPEERDEPRESEPAAAASATAAPDEKKAKGKGAQAKGKGKRKKTKRERREEARKLRDEKRREEKAAARESHATAAPKADRDEETASDKPEKKKHELPRVEAQATGAATKPLLVVLLVLVAIVVGVYVLGL
jgi:hypothetical protein